MNYHIARHSNKFWNLSLHLLYQLFDTIWAVTFVHLQLLNSSTSMVGREHTRQLVDLQWHLPTVTLSLTPKEARNQILSSKSCYKSFSSGKISSATVYESQNDQSYFWRLSKRRLPTIGKNFILPVTGNASRRNNVNNIKRKILFIACTNRTSIWHNFDWRHFPLLYKSNGKYKLTGNKISYKL